LHLRCTVSVWFVVGSCRFWHLRCPLAVRVLFGVVSFAGRGCCAFGVPTMRVVVLRGACRCVGAQRRRGPSGIICGATALGERCCCEHSTGHRDHRGALSPRSGRVFFAQRCHRHSSWGHTRPAWFSQGNGPVQPGFGCPRQGALGRPPRHDVLPSPACSTQPGTNLAGGNRLVPLQRSWGLEHPRQGQHLPGRGLPPQVRASLLPQALTRRTFSRCRTHHC